MKAHLPKSILEKLERYHTSYSKLSESRTRSCWVEFHDRIRELDDAHELWFLGKGCSRKAYSVVCEDGKSRVIKLEYNSITANNCERLVWDRIKDTSFRDNFFALYDESYLYDSIIVQELATVPRDSVLHQDRFYEAVEVLENELLIKAKVLLEDVRYEANAIWCDNKVKVFDYGHFKVSP